MRRRRPSPALTVALLALAVALGGVALAAPGGGGTIQGCYNERGVLRVIDTGAACEAGEQAITWNQQGPAGPQGPARSDAAQPFDAAEPPRSKRMDTSVKKPSKNALAKLIKISASGEPTNVFHAHREGPFQPPAPNSLVSTVARLDVPAGKYFVVAKGYQSRQFVPDSAPQPTSYCELQGTGQVDEQPLRPGETLLLTAVISTKKPRGIELRCIGYETVGNAASPYKPRLAGVHLSAMNVAKIKTKSTKPPF